jgi:hypothetical protein
MTFPLFHLFHWLSRWQRTTVVYEELSESSAFGSGRRDLHGGFRGRQAELCEDR